MPKMANQYRPWLAKCPAKTKWGSLIPRPLKMDEGLSTSKRQAEDEKGPIKYENLPILFLSIRQLRLSNWLPCFKLTNYTLYARTYQPICETCLTYLVKG